MARTSREQVDNLFPPERACVVLNASEFDAELMEAEQRGYERARAECADDTKRLDWLEKAGILSVEDGFHVTDIYIGPHTGTVRAAIDAAMKEDGQ